MSIVRDATAVHWASLVSVFGSEYITVVSTAVNSSGEFNSATGTNITETQTSATYKAVNYNNIQTQTTMNVFDEVDYLLNIKTVTVVGGATPIRMRDDVIINSVKYEIVDVQSFASSDLVRIRGKKKI